MLSSDYIRKLEGDRECIEALASLAEHGKRYPTGGFTPPLSTLTRTTEPTRLLALSLRIGIERISGQNSQITRIDSFDGSDARSFVGSPSTIAAGIAADLLCPRHSGSLLVTEGKKRQTLDVLLNSIGPYLLSLGYTIQPMKASGAVGWMVIRKGRHKWSVTYFEAATGLPVSAGLGIAGLAPSSAEYRAQSARYIHSASVAAQSVYLSAFGVAFSPTVGMTALRAARVTLPADFRKWRPDPLLVAMERNARGYRGGLTYARRFRGATVQIDVSRQYTHALSHELPRKWVFGRFPGYHVTRPGVYMCRVRLPGRFTYPIGLRAGAGKQWGLETVSNGEYVCVLHSPEIRAIIDAGGLVWPSFGFTASSTFSLGDYVSLLQNILTYHGRGSPMADLAKPLGNYVYGKLGQNPERDELLFSAEHPGKPWRPYFDELGNPWDYLWERTTEVHSPSHHVDVAGHIAAVARAQTLRAWVGLQESGSTVYRVHTDSITVDSLPASFALSDGNTIGGWRVEEAYADTIIIGASAYADSDGAHVAGLSGVTREQVGAAYDGIGVSVFRRIRKPRRGFERGEEEGERQLRTTANR